MKKIYKLFTLLLVSVLVISCGSDDNSISDEQGVEKQILGAWNTISIVDGGYVLKLDKCTLDNSKTFFFPDNTMIDQLGEPYGNECHVREVNYTYKISEDVLYLNDLDNEITSRFTFKFVDKNTLVVVRIYYKEGKNPAEQYEESEARVITFKRL